MANKNKETTDLVITHTFDAPVEKAWQAWTDENLVKRWWRVDGFSNILAKMDVREGGVSHVGMRASKDYGGMDYYNVRSHHHGPLPQQEVDAATASTWSKLTPTTRPNRPTPSPVPGPDTTRRAE